MLAKVHSPERDHIGYPFAFWSIAQCHDKLQGQEKYIYQFKRKINPGSLMQKVSGGHKLEETAHNFIGTESKYFTIPWQEVDDDAEREPKIGQSEPGEDEGENIILQISSVN